MKIIHFTILLALLSSCIGDGMTDFQREFVNRQKELEKLSESERLLVERLENKGYYEVTIDSPEYQTQENKGNAYVLNLKPPFALSSSSNSDKIATFSDSIAKVIYSEVMSEQAKNLSKKLKIRFAEGIASDLTILVKEYPISSLEQISEEIPTL